jgi:UDP-N-acetylglucosamine/UDP-N-acetylgalactosamine diphosphorylase
LSALSKKGATEKMRAMGIDILSYFQVDNPLVPCIDPAFIGFHLSHQSELSSKMIPKAYALEKVGMFCEYKGKQIVIEYSDMPQEMQNMKDANGGILFGAGSVAIHLFDRDFIDRIGGVSGDESLPYHKALKKIPYYDPQLGLVEPTEGNGIKFEMFVFDALPKSRNPLVIEGARNENFSPVKNAHGIDSPEACKQDLKRQAVRWLINAGEAMKLNADGLVDFNFEINYRFAMDGNDFKKQWTHLEPKPEIKEGTIIGS